MVLNYTTDERGAKRLQIASHGIVSTHEQCDPRRAKTYNGAQLFHLHPYDAIRLDERKDVTAQFSLCGRCIHADGDRLTVEFIDGTHYAAPVREFWVYHK